MAARKQKVEEEQKQVLAIPDPELYRQAQVLGICIDRFFGLVAGLRACEEADLTVEVDRFMGSYTMKISVPRQRKKTG